MSLSNVRFTYTKHTLEKSGVVSPTRNNIFVLESELSPMRNNNFWTHFKPGGHSHLTKTAIYWPFLGFKFLVQEINSSFTSQNSLFVLLLEPCLTSKFLVNVKVLCETDFGTCFHTSFEQPPQSPLEPQAELHETYLFTSGTRCDHDRDLSLTFGVGKKWFWIARLL